MFKCYDKIVGEIIESNDKEILLRDVNERFVNYNNTTNVKVSCYCIKNIYYLVEKVEN